MAVVIIAMTTVIAGMLISVPIRIVFSTLALYGISIYNTSEECFSRDLIGSSISGYQVLFTS